MSNEKIDFYGKRLATCSSDQFIKVFDKVENAQPGSVSLTTDDGSTWELSDSWKAHDSTIVKVVWADPEFGSVLASCSYDATVRIWEESTRGEPTTIGGSRWKRRMNISEYHGAVYDIAFAPSRYGLKLAAIDSEGVLHVHQALDPNNLTYWTSMLSEALVTKKATRSRQSAFALSWSKSTFWGEFVAVSAQDFAYIYGANSNGKYVKYAEFPKSDALIRDIAWAPSMGRKFQLIAMGSADGHVRIYKVVNVQTEKDKDPELEIGLLSDLDDHKCEVWKVSWNVTGTILASAGNDGNIRFWKSSFKNEFRCAAVVSAEQRSDIS